MITIENENKKNIRKAMDVSCGFDVHPEWSTVATSEDTYDGVEGYVSGILPRYTPLMDLSFGGFLNDGAAVPLESSHDGLIGAVEYDPASDTYSSKMELYIEVPMEALDGEPDLDVFYYDDSRLKRYTRNVTVSIYGYRQRVDLQSNVGRINVLKASVGGAWWFNNDNLVSCNVSLRGAETKIDNPELQISDIEIIGYEPNDVLEEIASVKENTPIYYSAGYPGDMSEVRRFYISDKITLENNTIRIVGEDATKFLDEEYSGKYVGTVSTGQGGGVKKYADLIDELLTNANIEHEYVNTLTASWWNSGSAFFVPNISKRSVIVQAMNVIRSSSLTLGDMRIDYVDAGIPRLIATDINTSKAPVYIDDYMGLSIDTDRRTYGASMTVPRVGVSSSAQIETVEGSGSTIRELSDPQYSVTTSRGSISLITPYTYKLNASGSAVISGRAINFYNRENESEDINIAWVGAEDGLEFYNLGTFYGMRDEITVGDEPTSLWDAFLSTIIDRGIKTYTFTWRGDPRIQPRDLVYLKVKNEYVLMTIESVTLEHEGGGLKSTIVAREGRI